MMIIGVVFLIIIGAIFLGLLIYAVSIYNGLVQVRHEVDRSWANIDVLLKQRHDELPKLIDTVQGYMKYEQDTFKKIIEARNRYNTAGSVGEKVQIENQLTQSLHHLFALSENYPELKANQSFMQLQGRISGLEENIADRREFYNASVNSFNIRINQIPDLFVARLLGYQPRELYKANETERGDVKIKFDFPQ